MNTSRRLVIRMAAVGAATSGLASLHWAAPATPLIGSRTQELLRLRGNVKSHTANRTATLAFANELKANRDDAIKRLMGPEFASMLSELPLSTRTTVGNIVFDLVGNSSSPALMPSPLEIDELSERLYNGIVVSGFFILDTWINTKIPDVPSDHTCQTYEDEVKEALGRCMDAYEAYLACERPKKKPNGDTAQIFPTSDWNIGNIPGNEGCYDEYFQVQRELYAYEQALEIFLNCVRAHTPRFTDESTP